jgi:hypothetical protein
MPSDESEEQRQFRDYFMARREVVRRTAYLLCGDWYWADDLTQTAFMRLAVGWRMTNGDDDRTRRSFVYRTDDGGATWQRLDPRRTLPYSYYGGASFIAADGTHVVAETSDSRLVWWTSRDRGGSYARAQLAGLGEVSQPVRVVAPGSYVTFNRDAVFRSTDGLTWTRLEINAQ